MARRDDSISQRFSRGPSVVLAAGVSIAVACSSSEAPRSGPSGASVDGGASSGSGCTPGVDCPCNAAADCVSVVCVNHACAAPSPTDGVKNGDETDVDCGGATAPKCAAGKGCSKHSDCTTDACPSTKCAASISCRQHFGGDTCGSGEVDDPAHVHEDCCASVQPGTKPYRLDKYLITAGRMRSFIEAVNGDVRSWVNANPEKLPPEWSDDWIDSVPATEGDVVQIIGSGQGANAYWTTKNEAKGCYAKGQGGPTYFHPADKLAQYSGDERGGWTQDELDVKTLNCTPRALFVAFCAWDGGRLPTYAEWSYAVRGDESEAARPFPWGAEENISERASYNFNYGYPAKRDGMPLAGDGLPLDRAFQVPAPGRFPSGNGPFGHADLLGLVETFVAGDPRGNNLDRGALRQYAFQEAYYRIEKYGNPKPWGHYMSHYALGARCARSL